MEGFDASTYGERFADVYDDWYGDLGDTAACVEVLAELAERGSGGAVLELGVGTGRLAVPLAERGVKVIGLDSSPAMLERLRAKPGGDRVDSVLGDMEDPPLGDHRFGLVVLAYNTLFNLTTLDAQRRCLAGAARRLTVGGSVVVEAFVPDPDQIGPADSVVPRTITADRVVLSVTRHRADHQEVFGQFVELTNGGVRLRPWHIRYSTTDQLDRLAADAGLVLSERWAGWDRAPFEQDRSSTHVSVYTKEL